MKIYSVRKITRFVGNTLIDSTHYYLFHFYEHGGREETHRYFGNKSNAPVDLYVNTCSIPECVQPRVNLIISKKLLNQQYAVCPNIELLPCNVVKFFFAPFKLGDFSHSDRGESLLSIQDLRKLVTRLKEVGRPSDAEGFWEIVCRQLWQIKELYNDDRHAQIVVGDGGIEMVEVPYGAIDEHAMFCYGNECLIREDLFAQVEHSFSKDFFTIREIPV